jgi:signal transduction histidine kinase
LANKELAAAHKDIIRAEKLTSLGRMSSGIAHEIGNPIGIVIGYLELLRQNGITYDERNEFIGRAEKEVNRINTIIRQLLDFSKSSGTGVNALSVHEIITDTANVLNVQPMMKKITINRFLDAEKDTVMADPDQLRQVFLNLILNACDAIASDGRSEDGKIDITTGIEDVSDAETGKTRPNLKITIVDNGPGISREHIDNIFDPFYTTKKAGEGTGLGLWVSLLMIDGIGGTIRATSEENRGTAITIHLPIH